MSFEYVFYPVVIDTEAVYIRELFPVYVLTGIADKLVSKPPGGSVFSPTLLLLAPLGTIQL